MQPLKTWRARAKTLNVNDNAIAYWVSEQPDVEKPWLLLVHGFPTSSWDWSGLWPKLEKKFNIAALDMLGFGLSDKPAHITYSIMTQADLQEALLAELGVSQAHLFVHDYGNTVAQELLARQLEGALSFSIQSIVFLNGGLFPEQHRPQPVQKFALTPFGFLLQYMVSRSTLRKNFDEIFGPDTKATDAEIDTHWALLTANNGRKVFHKLLNYIPERREHRERWVGALKRASTPMRLINGGADPISGEHLYHYYKEQIPNADAVLFPQLGHYPHTEDGDKVFAAFLEFHQQHGI